jgi:predicted nucleic acid-binding protein
MARSGRRLGATLVLDAEGLVQLARGNHVAISLARDAHEANGDVVTAASTLAEVLRGTPQDTRIHRVLSRITVVPIDNQVGRAAGELLGRNGLSGHQHALDALLAVVALDQSRPVVLLTSDPGDLGRLTDEPDRPARERIAVLRV